MLTKNQERYVQKAEACYILGIAPATINRWRRKYADFPKSGNPNPRGRLLLWLPALLTWAADNGKIHTIS